MKKENYNEREIAGAPTNFKVGVNSVVCIGLSIIFSVGVIISFKNNDSEKIKESQISNKQDSLKKDTADRYKEKLKTIKIFKDRQNQK